MFAKAAVGTEAWNYQVYGHSRALLSPAQFLQHGKGCQVTAQKGRWLEARSYHVFPRQGKRS